MSYQTISLSISANPITGFVALGDDLGSQPRLPAIPQVSFQPGDAALKLSIVGYKKFTATAAPTSIDLTAVPDVNGSSSNLARVKYVLITNEGTVDGQVLLLDGTVSNAWKAPFATIATCKLVIPSGYVDASGVVYPGMVLLGGPNTTGLVVSGTSKIISLDPGANTISGRVILLGNVA
jgi:hypothetical protein